MSLMASCRKTRINERPRAGFRLDQPIWVQQVLFDSDFVLELIRSPKQRTDDIRVDPDRPVADARFIKGNHGSRQIANGVRRRLTRQRS